jgi:pyridoxal phosphate enzyme (YggS family)
VDSSKLARALHNATIGQGGDRPGARQAVLIQVNTGREPQKSGVAAENLPALAEEVEALEGLRLAGLMCMPPFDEDPELARPHFAELRGLKEDLERRLGRGLEHLSMGMTQDFAQAIEEGATLVRIGTAIFGPRPMKTQG